MAAGRETTVSGKLSLLWWIYVFLLPHLTFSPNDDVGGDACSPLFVWRILFFFLQLSCDSRLLQQDVPHTRALAVTPTRQLGSVAQWQWNAHTARTSSAPVSGNLCAHVSNSSNKYRQQQQQLLAKLSNCIAFAATSNAVNSDIATTVHARISDWQQQSTTTMATTITIKGSSNMTRIDCRFCLAHGVCSSRLSVSQSLSRWVNVRDRREQMGQRWRNSNSNIQV